MTIKDSLKTSPLPQNESEIILSSILKKDRSFLHAHPEQALDNDQQTRLDLLIHRRQQGEPVQYLTNKAHFYGLEFYVDNRVLIPREETEDLVGEALTFVKNSAKEKITVVDIGTGSGNIVISLAKNSPNNKTLRLTAIDISEAALEVAKLNAKNHLVENQITFLEGSLLEPLEEKVDLICANLPYVRTHLYGVLDPQIIWEPKVAILGGDDGMLYYHQLFEQAKEKLDDNGLILYEIDGRIYQKRKSAL